MITKLIPKIFRARSARYLEDLQRYVPKIRDSEEYWLTRGEEKMRTQMAEWRSELERVSGKEVAPKLRAIRLNVLGLVCAAATQLCGRANADDSAKNWDMRPYDVQLLGGLTLQDRLATKANGIRELQALQHLHDHELTVFGDHNNDISMFQLADTAVATANATPELRQHATEIIGHHSEDSVVKYLEARWSMVNA